MGGGSGAGDLGSNSDGDARSPPPPPREDGDRWTCSSCTYENRDIRSSCEMCETVRDGKRRMKKRKPKKKGHQRVSTLDQINLAIQASLAGSPTPNSWPGYSPIVEGMG